MAESDYDILIKRHYSAMPFHITTLYSTVEYVLVIQLYSLTREPDPVIPGTMRQKIKNQKTSPCCPCQDDSIGMSTLHIGPAVSEKTGTVIKGFSFIVMGDM